MLCLGRSYYGDTCSVSRMLRFVGARPQRFFHYLQGLRPYGYHQWWQSGHTQACSTATNVEEFQDEHLPEADLDTSPDSPII